MHNLWSLLRSLWAITALLSETIHSVIIMSEWCAQLRDGGERV